MQLLLKTEYLKFINLLSYPVLIVDDNYVSQLANKKFMSLHKIRTKTETQLEDLIIDESMVEKEKYILEIKNKKMIFKLLSSKLLFKSKQFYLISFFDVSKEHEEHEEILFKKRMFEKLSEHLPEGIMVCEDKINYSNPTFEKFSGYSSKELLTKKFVDLLEDYSKELFNANIKKYKKK
jgi:PAS domain-containing protein